MFNKLILFFASYWSRASIYHKYLGTKFGKNVRFFYFPRFGNEPYLIEIGNNVTITRGVSFVTHEGGAALFRQEYPDLNLFGKIKNWE